MVLPPFESYSRDIPVQVRPAGQGDLPGIQALMAQSDMYGEFLAEECVVAEIESRMCGFVRIEVVGAQPYLRPIVVDFHAQGRGVGKALLHYIFDRTKSVIAIARGSAAGFYTRLGFLPVAWDQIYEPFRQECAACPDLAECQPQPMIAIIQSRRYENHPMGNVHDNPDG